MCKIWDYCLKSSLDAYGLRSFNQGIKAPQNVIAAIHCTRNVYYDGIKAAFTKPMFGHHKLTFNNSTFVGWQYPVTERQITPFK